MELLSLFLLCVCVRASQTDLEEERIKQKMANRTRSERCRIYTLRAAVNLFVVAVLISCFYCIFIATVFSQRKQAEVTTFSFHFTLRVLTCSDYWRLCVFVFSNRATFCWSWWWNICPPSSSRWLTSSHRWSSTSSSVSRIIRLPLRSASRWWGITFTHVFTVLFVIRHIRRVKLIETSERL